MGWWELLAIASELSGEWWQVDVAVGCIGNDREGLVNGVQLVMGLKCPPPPPPPPPPRRWLRGAVWLSM